MNQHLRRRSVTVPLLVRILGVMWLSAAAPVAAEESLCTIADSAIVSASEIRGLTIKHPVPCLIENREQIRDYLITTIDTKIPPQKLEGEAATYRALGFIPDDFDYKNGLIELYVSQIGGFYDPEKAHYVMASWMPAILQTTIAVHELTHALQDQYYDLKTLIDQKLDNSDMLLARSALVEGDATAVMVDYPRKLVGQPPLSSEKEVESIMLQNVFGASLMAGVGKVPRSLQLLLLFPYTSGLRFAHSKLITGGYAALDKVFQNPPRSTEEILHPEKYGSGKVEFIQIPTAELRPAGLPAEYEVTFDDTWGEFIIAALLGNFSADHAGAAEAAAGWGGDRLARFQDKARTHEVVVWKTHWDTVKDADEFHGKFLAAMRSKYPGLLTALPGPEQVSNPSRPFASVSRNGSDILFVAAH